MITVERRNELWEQAQRSGRCADDEYGRLLDAEYALTHLYGVEREVRNEWWDLFCSPECVANVYGRRMDDAELFTKEEFYQRTGVWLRDERCLNCNGRVVRCAA